MHVCACWLLFHVYTCTSVALILLITGPALPVTPELLSSISMSTSVTIRWEVPRVAYTPETFIITYGRNDDIQTTYSVNGGMSEGLDDESFLTSINVSYQQIITNLSTVTSYWYRINSTNSFGNTVTKVDIFNTTEAGECSQDYSCINIIYCCFMHTSSYSTNKCSTDYPNCNDSNTAVEYPKHDKW